MDVSKSILTTRRILSKHVDKEKKRTITLKLDKVLSTNKNKKMMDDVSKTILHVKERKMKNDLSEEEVSNHILNEKTKLLINKNKRKRNDVCKARNKRPRMLNYKSEMPTKKKSSNIKRKMNNVGERNVCWCDRYLPEELIFNILSNTCVTLLLRCNSVCKLWRSIISKPKFMNAHHVNSVNRIPSIMMITSRIDDNEGCHGVTIVYPSSPQEDSVNVPLMPPFDNLGFVSSLNGVVCVFNEFFGDLYLLNPLTRMTKKLTLPPAVATVTRRPRMLFSVPPGPYSASINYPPALVIDNTPPLLKACKADVGFGFDCVSHDFKVLLVEFRNTDNRHVDLAAVNLYSSSSDSWRSIEVGIDLPSLLYYPFCPVLMSGPVVEGVLYMEGADAIITFDLHNELFGLIPYPSFIHTRKSNVLDFEGSVAVVLETVPDGSLDEKELSLWTPVAVSDEVVWNKIFTFGSGSEEIDRVFLYSGANQFFGKTRLGEMLYDYKKKQTKYVGLPSQSFLVRVLNHTESFLSVEGFEAVKDS